MSIGRRHNPAKWVWDDEYQGPRWVYYSPLRPVSATMLPRESTAVIKVGMDPRTVVVTEPLPEHFVDQWSLELVESPPAHNPRRSAWRHRNPTWQGVVQAIATDAASLSYQELQALSDRELAEWRERINGGFRAIPVNTPLTRGGYFDPAEAALFRQSERFTLEEKRREAHRREEEQRERREGERRGRRPRRPTLSDALALAGEGVAPGEKVVASVPGWRVVRWQNGKLFELQMFDPYDWAWGSVTTNSRKGPLVERMRDEDAQYPFTQETVDIATEVG